MKRSRTLVVLAVTLAVGLGSVALTTAGGSEQLTEINVQGASNPDAGYWRGGEPEIAVNPRNPRNMVMTWAAMKQVKESHTGLVYPGTAAQFAEPPTGTQTIQCQMAYSFDGGHTWTAAVVPLRGKPSCGDPMVVADSAGAFYIGYDLMGSELTPNVEGTQLVDNVAVSRSTDGGLHWSVPVDVGTIVDRPFFRVDRSTDWLYEASGGPPTGVQRSLVISKDHGRTWTPKRTIPSGPLAVNHGVIATSLHSGPDGNTALAQDAPAAGAYMFAWSTDNGATYQQSAIPGASPGGAGNWVSANPSHPGSFAVMQQVGDALEVLTTQDSGTTWSKALHLGVNGRGMALPWLDYGPNGDLGVMWKSTDKSTSRFLVYTALMPAGRTSFTQPMRISSAQSAGADFVNEGAGDDLSWITVDNTHTYVGWGDRRTGLLQAWFARVRLHS